MTWRSISPPAGIDMEFRTTEARGGRASYTAAWNRDRVWFWGGYRSAGADGTLLQPADQGAVYFPKTDEWHPWQFPDPGQSSPAVPRAEHFAYMNDAANMIVVGGVVPTMTIGAAGTAAPTGDAGVAEYFRDDRNPTHWRSFPPPGLPAGTTPNFIVYSAGGTSADTYLYEFGLLGDGGPGTFGAHIETFFGASVDTLPAPDLLSPSRNERADRSIFYGSTPFEQGVPRATSGNVDLVRKSWQSLAAPGEPGPRTGHTFVNGVVWGGQTPEGVTNEGALVQIAGGNLNLTSINGVPIGDGGPPDTIQWHPISRQGAPSPRMRHAAVAIGRSMLIFGGARPGTTPNDTEWLNDGGVYDTRTDAWTPLPKDGAPPPLRDPVALWTRRDRPCGDPGNPACAQVLSYRWDQNAVIIWGTSVDDPRKGQGAILLLPDDWGD